MNSLFRAPLRFYGTRKLICVLLAWPVCLILCWLLSGRPPVGWYSWPMEGRSCVGSLVNGLYDLTFFGWLWLVLLPFRQSLFPPIRYGRWAILAAAVLCWGFPGLFEIVHGLDLWLVYARPFSGTILWLMFRIAGIPIGIGTLIAHWPDLTELLHALPLYRRLYVSGQGHAAGWLGPRGTRRFVRHLPQTAPAQAGHLSRTIHLGQTLPESCYVPGQNIWLNETSHLLSFGQTGSGKFVTSIASNLAMYQGSGIFISTKAELADFAVGRRSDQSLLDDTAERRFRSCGIDTRGVTQARYQLPGGRSFVLDPSGQSGWPTSSHNILSEIDIRHPSTPGLISSIAEASFPDDPNQRDKFWVQAPRGLFAAGIGHILTTAADPRQRTLPYIADFCMGIDPQTGRADRQVFFGNLVTMMENRMLGGFIQKNAAAVAQLGKNTFGSVFAEFELHTRWLSDVRMRRHLSGRSDFSYRELGEDDSPVSVFPILPRSSNDLQTLVPWLRTHMEVGLNVLENKRQRPQTPVLILCDEFLQYGDRVNAIRKGATTLREAGVRLWLFSQSWSGLVSALGEEAALGLQACSAMEFFGTDNATAGKIAQMMGRHSHKRRGGNGNSPPLNEVLDVITTAEAEIELRKNSPIKYVFPMTSGPMRIRRVAYRPMVTEEGTRYAGLPLTGHYDEHLSRYTYRHRSA
ncbi:type IV secretory system conjugative DNA transfer family protein [Planctomicrobium sp. SH668]|uniref:type IV secretory system conjugative DNA transfer family protein n=1 Tax=Planctomicrobium sp. SH668 TaxID=3448126 RepID=UPI003F5B185F